LYTFLVLFFGAGSPW